MHIAREYGRAAVLLAVLVLGACGRQSVDQSLASAQEAVQAGNVPTALILLKSVLQEDPTRNDARLLLARTLLSARDFVGAALELNKLLDQGGDSDTLVPLLAQAYTGSGDYRRLILEAPKFRLGKPESVAEFQTALALAYVSTGGLPKALEAIETASRAVPDFEGALALRAKIHLVARETAAAEALAVKMTRLFPKSAVSWYLLADAGIQAQRANDEVESHLKRALEIDRAYVPAHSLLVQVQFQKGDEKRAKEYLSKFLEVAPQAAEAQFMSAQLALRTGEVVKAREIVQSLMRNVKDNINLLQLAAAVEWSGGSLTASQRYLDRVLSLDPRNEAARINLAHVSLRLAQPARALIALGPILKSPSPPPGTFAAAGEAALQLGDATTAEQYYRRASAELPSDARINTALALSRLELGQVQQAFDQLSALTRASSDGYADVALASARLARRDFDGALRDVDELIRKLPQPGAGAFELRGRILQGKQDLPGARAAFDRALSIDSQHIPTIKALMTLDVWEGKPGSAIVRFDTFAKSYPENVSGQVALSELRVKAGVDPKLVMDGLREAARLSPTDPEPRLKLIDMLVERRQFKTALVTAQEASPSFERDVRVQDALGRMLEQDGNLTQAVVVYRKLVALEPLSSLGYIRMAGAEMKLGNKSRALANLLSAVGTDPSSDSARRMLIGLALELKRPDEVVSLARELQKERSKASGPYLLEGGLYMRQGKFAAASDVYRKAMEAGEQGPDLAVDRYMSLMAQKRWPEAQSFALGYLARNPGDAGMAYLVGEWYMIQQNWVKAEEYFRRSVNIRPDAVPSLNNLAGMLNKQGKPEGLEFAIRADRLSPGDPIVMDTLAASLALNGKLQEAIDLQTKAADVASSNLEIAFNLGKLALKAGKLPLARQQLERVVAGGSASPVAQEAKQLLAGL